VFFFLWFFNSNYFICKHCFFLYIAFIQGTNFSDPNSPLQISLLFFSLPPLRINLEFRKTTLPLLTIIHPHSGREEKEKLHIFVYSQILVFERFLNKF